MTSLDIFDARSKDILSEKYKKKILKCAKKKTRAHFFERFLILQELFYFHQFTNRSYVICIFVK